MLELRPLATCRSSTALKRPDRLKHCHCLQFAQIASLASCITLRAYNNIRCLKCMLRFKLRLVCVTGFNATSTTDS